MSDANQLPAPVAGNGDIAVSTEDGTLSYTPLADSVQHYWTSVRAETPGERVRLAQALDGDTDGFAEAINQDLDLEHVVLSRGTYSDPQTGEVRPATRVVLITRDGRCLGGMSGGILRSIQSLAVAFGLPPWRPALRCKLIQKELSHQRRMYKLLVMGVIEGEPVSAGPPPEKRKPTK